MRTVSSIPYCPPEPKDLPPKILQFVSSSPQKHLSVQIERGIGYCLVQPMHFTDEKLISAQRREIMYLKSHEIRELDCNLGDYRLLIPFILRCIQILDYKLGTFLQTK